MPPSERGDAVEAAKAIIRVNRQQPIDPDGLALADLLDSLVKCIEELKAERERAMENACKAVCEGCAKGHRVTNGGMDHGFPDEHLAYKCRASAIRSLKGAKEPS